MNQYNTLDVKLFNSQLNKLKLGIKNVTRVTLNLSSNVVSDSYDETNFLHKLLLTNTQVSRLQKAFANGSLANVKLSKDQLPKMVQLGGECLFGLLGVAFDPIKIIASLTTPQWELYRKNRKKNAKIFLQTQELIFSVKKKKKKNGLSKIKGSGIKLTNNEKKYIRKVISSLKNRKICQKLLLKRKTT